MYEETSREFVDKLEKGLYRYLSEKIIDERSKVPEGEIKYKTKFDMRFSKNIGNDLLTAFENFKYIVRPAGLKGEVARDIMDTAIEDLNNIKRNIWGNANGASTANGLNIFGFPLNMTYISEERIWQEVRNTEIFDIRQDDTEFLLTVSIYAYPNYVLSVWIFVGVVYLNSGL